MTFDGLEYLKILIGCRVNMLKKVAMPGYSDCAQYTFRANSHALFGACLDDLTMIKTEG